MIQSRLARYIDDGEDAAIVRLMDQSARPVSGRETAIATAAVARASDDDRTSSSPSTKAFQIASHPWLDHVAAFTAR